MKERAHTNTIRTESTMVDTNITVYSLCMVPVALGLIGACIRGWWLDRDDSYEHTAYAALHSPSVRTARNAFDRRVALAVREAKQGARACGGCGFTNAMHATACVRCSAVLTGEKSKSTFRTAWSGGQKATAAEGVPASQQSDLQRRIRRRREWSRRVNAEGKLEWHRDEQLGGSTTRAFPSYVLQSTSEVVVLSSLPTPPSKQPHPRDETLEVVIATDESTATDEAPEEPAEEMKSVVDVSSELRDAIERTHVAIVDASDADASRIAYSNNESHVSEPVETEPSTSSSSSPTSAASANNKTSASPQTFATITTDNATNVELPFPAKLAQFITSMAGLVGATNVNTTSSSSRITLPRESLLNDSLVALATLSRANVRSPVRVDFLGEQGIDAGGVYREWFQLLNEAIVTPEAGIFTCVDHQNQTFYLNPHSREILGDGHLAHFLAAGRLLGRALLDGNVTGFHLAMPLLKIILGQPVGFSDLQYYDPEVYKHLTWLLEHDGVDALCLDFTVTEKLPGGGSRTVELVPGGAEIEVTDANKVEFVDAKLKYLLFESVSEQLFAYLTGVYEVVPAEVLAIFDAEELDYVLSGSDAIDVDDWEANTLASTNLVVHPALNYFWKVVRELTTEERRYLLQFATGSSRVPPGGFRALTSNDGKLGLFNLRGVQAKTTHGYLHSHACFNRLDIPLHGSLKKTREAVRAAISSESFGFTTD